MEEEEDEEEDEEEEEMQMGWIWFFFLWIVPLLFRYFTVMSDLTFVTLGPEDVELEWIAPVFSDLHRLLFPFISLNDW